MRQRLSELMAAFQSDDDAISMNEVHEMACLLIRDNQRLQNWVSDCQSGMYINCVYCGHRYGPREDTPVAMADVLREHIEQCPQHPLSAAKAKIESLQAIIDSKLHQRKCHDCGHVSWCSDSIRPYCLCEECGSQDTRRLKQDGRVMG